MPGKNSKQTAVKTETPVAPVAEQTVEVAPAKTTQKGGKKATSSKAEVSAPVVESTPVVEATPAKTTQKGGKKAAASKAEVSAPVVEATPAKTTQKGGKKAAASKVEASDPVVVSVTTTEAPAKGAKKSAQKGGKKAASTESKKAEKPAEEEADEESGDRRIRSFKVRLPGKEEFEGRFTGLTPYQAANKALSKYFRETEKPKTEITFSICESTRKSKKAVYTYVGRRQKLDKPVSYKIQSKDENGKEVVREIVKNFKNSLKKVKKSEATESA
jgi:hypothetical protein